MDQRVAGRGVGGLKLHGQRPEAALSGAFKGLAVLQQRSVQVEADVCLKTLWEPFEDLEGRPGRVNEGTDRKYLLSCSRS